MRNGPADGRRPRYQLASRTDVDTDPTDSSSACAHCSGISASAYITTSIEQYWMVLGVCIHSREGQGGYSFELKEVALPMKNSASEHSYGTHWHPPADPAQAPESALALARRGIWPFSR